MVNFRKLLATTIITQHSSRVPGRRWIRKPSRNSLWC